LSIFGRQFVCSRTVICPVMYVLSVTLVYCGQTVGRIKIKLGLEVGLGPGHTVLDSDPALHSKRSTAVPQFSADVYCGQTAGWIKMPLGTEPEIGHRPRPRPHCVRWGPSSHHETRKRVQQPRTLFGPCLLCSNGRPSQHGRHNCINVTEM